MMLGTCFITVLCTRQLEATKRRVIAELKELGIARSTAQYSVDIHRPCDVIVKAITAEYADGKPQTMQQGIE